MSKDTLDSPQLLGEISQAPSAFEQFLDRHQKGLVVVAILAALGGCGWVVYRGLERSHERDAGTALVKAEDITSLQSLVKDYPKTEAAGSAALLLAEKQWSDGQQGDAIKTLQDFIQAKPDHPARPSAQASLGSKFATQGKNAEAEAALQAVIDNPAAKYLAPYALTQLGDLAKTAGDLDRPRATTRRRRTTIRATTSATSPASTCWNSRPRRRSKSMHRRPRPATSLLRTC